MSGSSIDESAVPVARATPAPPLDYGRSPTPMRWGLFAIGIVASAMFAFGCAMIAAAVVMVIRNDRDAPPIMAIGVGCNVFGVGVIASTLLARRR